MIKTINYLMYGILVILAAIVAAGIYVYIWPVEFIKPNVQPYKAITKEVRRGDIFIYEADLCKFKASSPTVVRRFVNDSIMLSQPVEITNVKAGCGKTHIPTEVPEIITPGVWHMELTITYEVNAFRNKVYRLKTEDFRVLEN